MSDAVAEKLQQETGVRVVHVSAVPNRENAQPLAGRADADAIGAAPANPLRSSPLSSVSLFDYRDWKTGAPGLLSVAIQLSIGEIYDRISGSKGNGVGLSLGQRLLVVLGLIGLLFLVIEFLALVVGLALAKSITGSIHELFTGTRSPCDPTTSSAN